MDAIGTNTLASLRVDGVFILTDAMNSDMIGDLSTALVRCAAQLNRDARELFSSEIIDGSYRSTFASRSNDPFEQCDIRTRELVNSYKKATQEVGARVAKFLEDLIRTEPGLSRRGYLSEFVESSASDSLDNFHVYTPKDTSVDQSESSSVISKSIPFHVDMGLFLLLTPAIWISDTSPLRGAPGDSDLVIKRRDGSVFKIAPSKDQNSIIVLIGSALTNWLYPGTSMRAAVHAVNPINSINGDHRVVLGRMFLPPMQAVSVKGIVFEDFFKHPLKVTTGASDPAVAAWRRLTETRCNAGEKYCWMDCMPEIDCGSGIESVCMNENTGRTCLDTDCDTDCKLMCPAVPTSLVASPTPVPSEAASTVSPTDASTASPKATTVKPKATTVSPQSAKVNEENVEDTQQASTTSTVEPTSSSSVVAGRGAARLAAAGGMADEIPFCRGGTSMVMSGFESVGSPNANCIILFFRPWLLNSAVKFAFGCLGVFLLGLVVEATIKLRRSATNRMQFKSRFIKNFVVVSLFAVNVALGYMCMLAAMTFNVELFISTVMGLAIGHLLLGNSNEPVRETADPCCVTSEAANNQIVVTSLVNSSGACCCVTR